MSLLWGDNDQSKFKQQKSTREETAVEIEMYENAIKQLYQMLTIACQERDEARIQLQRSVDEISELKKFLLRNRLLPSNNTPVVSHVLQPAAGSLIPTKITDFNASDYIPETNSNHSPFSSQVDGISFAVSSPGFSNLSDSSNSGLIQQPFLHMGSNHAMLDRASMVINNLVKGKQLPEKGKLSQAVMDAGPLLEALLLTRPLPKWRNPPHMSAHFQREVVDSNSANIPSSPLLNFAQHSSMPCLSGKGSMHHQSLTGKRTRFQ